MKRYLYRREDVILETALPSSEPGRELLAVFGEDRLYALPQETVFIGNAPPCQLVAKERGFFAVLRPDGEFCLHAGTVYRNGRRFSAGSVRLRCGDKLYFGESLLCFRGDSILLSGEKLRCSLEELPLLRTKTPRFPQYSRSPRTKTPLREETVELFRPEPLPEQTRGEQLRRVLLPLGALLLMGGSAFLMGRYSMLLLGGGMLALTLCFALAAFFKGRQTARQRAAERSAGYAAYLLRQQKRLAGLRDSARAAAAHEAPELSALAEMAERYSPRIYERSPADPDFLELLLGRSRQAAPFRIRFDAQETKPERDPLCAEALALQREFSEMAYMPRTVKLTESQLGLVGEPERLSELLRGYLLRLCFFHSYHELRLILLCRESTSSRFRAFAWCPHFELPEFGIRGPVFRSAQAEAVLASLSRTVRERRQRQRAEEKGGRFMPHYLLVAEDASLLTEHSLLAQLVTTWRECGISLIYCARTREALPESIRTIVTAEGGNEALLCLRDGLAAKEQLFLEEIGDEALERSVRRLAGLRHCRDESESLPERLGFLALYGVKRPEELEIAARWARNRAAEGLAAPLGVRAAQDTVALDLHESAHGPHALLAGTTGSGKSELLQSLILSLALQFSPEEIGFLLIDYKGGGMAHLFADLPHLLGTVTNLDGGDSRRALLAVKSELARRQRLFQAAVVNHIDAYGSAYRSGAAKEPLPHLFLIADEFAELKAEQPEFMAELISTARVGRSLGIHLILATQKPSGVVNEQIWSNARCKIALKVQTEADSRELLKTSDAADLRLPGRAYLQVGNREIYELFQSAYSGAPYRGGEAAIDDRIYRLNGLGQRELICRSENGGDKTYPGESELRAVIREIRRTAERTELRCPARLWLPPLPRILLTPRESEAEGEGFSFPLGLMDMPEAQRMLPCSHEFFGDGNFAVFGAGGMGKSSLLQSAALSLARRYSCEALYFYLLDFGAGALAPLKDLPHAADYISFDEEEKLKKLTALLGAEIRRRKRLLAERRAAFSSVSAEEAEPLPVIVLFLDHYDAVKELGQEADHFFLQLAREGTAVGIYLALSASRPGALRYALLNHIKDKVALYLLEPAERAGAVGRTSLTLPEIRGRALIQREGVHLMQCYRAADAEGNAYAEALAAEVAACAANTRGKRPAAIPCMPEFFTAAELRARHSAEKQDFRYAVGLDTGEIAPRSLSLFGNTTLLIGRAQCGKTNLLSLLYAAYEGQNYVIDCGGDLYPLAEKLGARYADDAASLEELRLLLETEIKKRRASYELSGKTLRMRDYFRREPKLALWIDAAERLPHWCQAKANDWEQLLRAALELGVTIVATASSTQLGTYDALSKLLREAQSGVIFGAPDEQTVFRLPGIRSRSSGPDTALLYERGRVSEIRIPLADPLL